jgi:hypothetical protein
MDIPVNGHALYAYTGGKPFDPAQPTVVFIHGVLNDHSVDSAKPPLRPPRLERAGHRPARPGPQQRRAARQRRRSRATVLALLDAVGAPAPRWWATASAR